MAEKISLRNDVKQGLDSFGNGAVPVDGTPSDKIEQLLRYPSELKELENREKEIRIKAHKTFAELQEAHERIKELEEAKENILKDESNPDKQARLEFDKEQAEAQRQEKEKDRELKRQLKAADLLISDRKAKWNTYQKAAKEIPVDKLEAELLDGMKAVKSVLGERKALPEDETRTSGRVD